ncbi:hypothetical protein AB1Y20_019575 [Prymnesium parvum]|uniref:ODAD1 central coiled coil region domain-containing protein n=1 Tax=Prymnesium parvum TaxID=97485 RepID=A0AB34JSR9_PRYPA|mmetsp:Transcript_3077/g.7213  ORF Transcript_3077/g.7213 Transcript_3077/m.7213 type:complete len:557 (-) Transcript_3077:451-2121(-)
MSSVTDATPASVEAELEELQRRYRMMESDRKAYADEVQNVVRKQKSQIDKLKRENVQLKQELQLQSRSTVGVDGNMGSTQITRLQDATDQISRLIEAEKKRSDDIDQRTKTLRDGILQERRDMGGNNAPQEQNQAINKQVKVLEHRLHRALIKFNEAIAANKELREEIDNLRRERVVFDGIYKKLQHELAEKKKRMAEIIEVANVAYEARDRAQAEIASLKLQSEKEQVEFEAEWKELGRKLEEDRKRQDFLTRERQRLLQLEQRGEMSFEDEQQLKKLVTKGHWGLAKDKASIHAGMEKVQTYEEAFAKIQSSTGISDIDQLVKQFIENEDRNFKMFNYLNELNGEIEKGEEAIAELKVETEKYRGQDKGAASQRKRLIKELQDRSIECDARTAQFEEAFKGLAGSIGQISRIIEELCSKLGCNTKLLQEMGTEAGCNESNIMIYLGLVEQRANELLAAYLSLQHHGHTNASPWHHSNHHDSAPPGLLVGPNTPQGMSTVQITVPTTSEDYESEESEEEEEHPLSRDELQAKTMRGLAKRDLGTKKTTKMKINRK